MVVIAIDGPGGSGKSTIGRALGARLSLPVLDTGAMYRAVTLLAQRAGVAAHDAARLAALARAMELELDGGTVLNGEEVSVAIRTPEVDREVSLVAAHPPVRAELVRRQREWVAKAGGAVVEGRDIGSVVLPDAEVKVYLTASSAERARRRASERGDDGPAEHHEKAISRRDRIDSGRADSPLVVAEGAVVIDSTEKGVEEVVEEIAALAKAAEGSGDG